MHMSPRIYITNAQSTHNNENTIELARVVKDSFNLYRHSHDRTAISFGPRRVVDLLHQTSSGTSRNVRAIRLPESL